MDPHDAAPPLDLVLLPARIGALEQELARHAVKYGVTAEARRMLRAGQAINPDGTGIVRLGG